jgi:hypothetical protein
MAPSICTKPIIHSKSHDPSKPHHFGIYLHTNLYDPASISATLAARASDLNSAYVALIKHAGDLIGTRPDWGAMQQGTKNHVYEVST